MKQFLPLAVFSAGLTLCGFGAERSNVTATIYRQELHAGRINPKLFGNFVELLDDVVPGMWAELLNDRSFEGVIPAAKWCYYDGSPTICDRQWNTNRTWTYDNQGAFNGDRCVRLTASPQPATLGQSELSVKKSGSYAFSAYLRADAAMSASVLLKCLLPTGDWLTLAEARIPPVSERWQKYSVEMVSRGETDHAVFELRCEGAGHLWADKLSLMPGDSLGGWRRDVVEAIKAVHPAIIRWGGSSVDPGNYRWKSGIGDRDERRPWKNAVWGRIDSNDVGIDEFCQFCELTGAQPLVCVSFSDGAQSAADLVEYCNGGITTPWGKKRAAHGHPAAYRVQHWQLGNEVSGDNPAYLDQIGEFIAKMKAADATVSIMASFPSQKLLARFGKDLAYVCPHHYTTDLEECEGDFRRLGQMIEHTPRCAHIKIGVTEWNIDAGSWGLGRARQATLGAALLNARYLQLLMRHSDKVEIACRSNLANSFCGAIIETGASGLGVLKRPSYHIMNLYSRHMKPRPLWIEEEGNRLDLLACSSENDESLVIFAVNSRADAVEFSFAFRGFSETTHAREAETVCDTRHAGQPDIMNHWNDPERVGIVRWPVSRNQISLPPLSATAILCER